MRIPPPHMGTPYTIDRLRWNAGTQKAATTPQRLYEGAYLFNFGEAEVVSIFIE